jgi:curved DNA-binding protein CbpA
MGTLYELLGALPHDDAEDLRTAFRKAAKATHPDTNPDDPDASLRFRQLVRANDILGDAEQRATYDELLALALRQAGSNSRRTTIYQAIHKHASNTLAATIISGILIGGYTLFAHVAKVPVIPDKVIEVAAREPVKLVPREPAEVTVTAPAEQSQSTGRDEPRDKHESIATADAVIAASAVAPAASPPATANVGPVANQATNDARSYRKRGIFAYREGDLNRALADFDRAIQRDPNFADAYVDRSIVLYRLRAFDRAFADIAQAKRIENSGRTRASAQAPRKTSPVRPRDPTNDY